MVKTENILNIALVILAVVAMWFLLTKTGVIEVGRDAAGDINIDFNTGSSSNDRTGDLDSGTHICNAFVENYPTYFFVREIQCGAAGGDWKCKSDKAGCYDITSWDHVTMCSTAEVQGLKAMCSAMGGGWTCTATEVSCER